MLLSIRRHKPRGALRTSYSPLCSYRSAMRRSLLGLLQRTYVRIGKPAVLQPLGRAVRAKFSPRSVLSDLHLQTIDTWVKGFAGKKVLEVGCDVDGLLVQQIANFAPVEQVVGMNLVISRPSTPRARVRLEPGDIRKTTYPAGAFDVIVSSSAFEHIHHLDEALLEMFRILAPGGFLYAHFGPIWSTSYGHHLWVEHEGRWFNYKNVVLPPWCHLLMSEDALHAWLVDKYPPELTSKITKWVYHSPEQNRLLFPDYQRIVSNSPFRLIFMKGYDVPDLAAQYRAQTTPGMFAQLAERYGALEFFGYDGLELLLSKP